TRVDGEVITAAKYMADQIQHATENRPTSIDDASTDVTAFRTTKDPGAVGSEALPVTLEEELHIIRHVIRLLKPGATQWYQDAPAQGDPVYAEVFGA
ncbi:MAG TPA: hypothetical protein VF406_21475, partial [Thermodesulfobacteriota bacterium]